MPELVSPPFLTLLGLVLLHAIGIGHIVHVLIHGRTAQGTIAWIVCMAVLPWLAIPFYWIAGRRRFTGYVRARRSEDEDVRRTLEDLHRRLREYELEPDDAFGRAARTLGGLPFTKGNDIELLIDGDETFTAIFRAIASAENYLLVNFFIVKNDLVGRKFQQALIERARKGVRVFFLFDEIGSHKLPNAYLAEMEDAGIECHSFGTNRFWWSRLQINFRNHRKIVVVDGREAFIGGLNVGDEYLGRDKKFGAWRDTHLQLRGPTVQAIQLVFLEDWNWAADERITGLDWDGDPQPHDEITAILPTGPADPADSWQLIVAEACNSAKQRLWITSPYFVPDAGVLTALQTAAIRGVDVRILLPEKADHRMVWLAAFTFYEETLPYGIRLFRYHEGFLHQKVMLVDDRYGFVGTGNLDNRSFRLNFEITAVTTDTGFIGELTEMLEKDFDRSREVEMEDFTKSHVLFRLACRAARLAAPVL
ncbi:cardiolipin synthase [Haloferula sp. A504]|uniref:cardiolipin synthase n=1 Tax=Haloferula sp. A504 TaxID=3373601 RepID=UPI0031C9B361|nr:cardiolipin synthase [Verrucomicrobiaceae bacterium E54]